MATSLAKMATAQMGPAPAGLDLREAAEAVSRDRGEPDWLAGLRREAAGIWAAAPHTTSTITSKSISKDGGRGSYRGMVKVHPGAHGSKVNVRCDALILDPESRSDTYPTMEIAEQDVRVEHEATVSKVGEEQLFYLMSRGITAEEATLMIVNGFIEPFTKELPMEYAVELNRLIQLEMEGSVG